MPFLAFEGPAGTGKTHHLIAETRANAGGLIEGQRVLGLTFMHGSRRRLDESFSKIPELRQRSYATTIDSFAAHIVRRWNSIAPVVADFRQFDQVCDACGALVERPDVARWVASAFPLIAIDEAQELNPCRLRIAQALSRTTRMVVAADEFQCLDERLDTAPFMEWLATGDIRNLAVVRRTQKAGLLSAGVALRAGAAVSEGAGLRIRYEYPAQVKFSIGHALRGGTGTRAMLVTPGSANWANELVPQLAAGLRSRTQNIPPLPMIRETSPEVQILGVVETVFGAAEQVGAADLIERLKSLDHSPTWVRMVITSIEMARRAHGQQLWLRPDLLTLCSRKASAHRAYSYSPDRGIHVMTIQAAKNRQFKDVVVLWGPGVPGTIDHQRRLLYNAITRAEQRCTVIVRTRQQLQQAPFA